MKKIIITLMFLAISKIIMAQNTDWSNWTKASQCFTGIEWRVKRESYNEAAKKWL